MTRSDFVTDDRRPCPDCGGVMHVDRGLSVMGMSRNGWRCGGCGAFYAWNEYPEAIFA